ncbi:DUF7507 domain-containing protein, partial [Fontibacter flavus]
YVNTNETSEQSATATTTITQSPSLTISKTVDATNISAPQDLTYTITVTNTGNVSLTGVAVTDPFAGGATLESGDADNDGVLDIGEAWVYSAVYAATQSDIDAGDDLVNTAYVNTNETSEQSATATTTITQSPSLTISKTVDATNISAPQDLTYTITVTNTGNVSLTGVAVTDPFAGGAALESGDANNNGVLDIGEAWVYSAVYAATQSDIDAGDDLVNTAFVNTNETSEQSATATTTITQSPSLTISKTVDATNISAPQDLTYTITVTNTGNVSLTGVAVTDPFAGGATLESGDADNDGVLDIGEAWVYSAVYAATQSDIDAGDDLVNTAYVNTNETSEQSATATTTITQNASIIINKTADKTVGILEGDLITYTYVVTNTGNVSINNISVDDVHPGTGTLSTLSTSDATDNVLPGQTVTFTATYTVTQQDIDLNTSIVNTATATGIAVNGDPVSASDTETITPEAASPSIELIKEGTYVDANGDELKSAGDQIVYTFTITNTGNVSLTNVVVTDPFVEVLGEAIPVLTPGSTDATTFTAVYTVTQADVDRGNFRNTAQVTGQYNGDVTATDDDFQTFASVSRIRMQKTADKTTNVEAGDVITYTYVVRNTGNVTINDVNVTDDHPGTGVLSPITTTDPTNGIAPYGTVTFTATYTVTQEDIDNNIPITNTATATATCVRGCQLEWKDTETITPIEAAPQIDLQKEGTYVDTNGDGRASAGDQITYTFTITNNGNVTLNNVLVTDPLVTMEGVAIASLAPGSFDGNTFTAVYTLTQEDIDAGSFTNTATVSSDYKGENVNDTDSDTQTFVRVSGVEIEKTADKTSVSGAGEEIIYTLTVTNTGNVTLENVNVIDVKVNVDQNVGTLAPGESASVTATYVVSQTDMDAGTIVNVATVSGTDPNGEDTNNEDSVTVGVNQNPSLALNKSADKNSVSAAGEEIIYTLTVRNNGNVTLENVTVVDAKVNVNENVGTLAPGESATVTATYVVSQADMDTGSIVNVATVSGTDPNGNDTDTEDGVTVDVDQNASLSLNKTADKTSVSAAGEEIVYTLTVTNNGNVTIENVTVVDERVNVNENVGTLAPGQSATVTATYVVSQADMDAGSIVNVATVSGTDPNGNDTDTEDGVTVDVDQNASLSLSKTADKTSVSAAGEEIVYTLTVTNNGNVTIENVTVVDERVNVNENVGTLAPGQSATVTATYVVSQADMDAGTIVNVATVSGTDPNGADTDTEDEVVVEAEQIASLTVEKTSDVDQYSELGEVIVYTITVTNTGTVSLTDVNVVDPLTKYETIIPVIAPGVSVELETSYTVTIDDLEAGSILNTVNVVATDPNGNEVTGTDNVTVSGSAKQIIANDDDFGDRFLDFTGVLGNILENDLLEGQRPDPDDVDFEFTELDGIIGLNINENGELSLLIPGINEAREYTLRYVLRETANPTNSDEAFVVFRLLNNEADLSVTKTSNEIEIFEGDEFDYVITVSNVGGTDATEVEVTDDLPNGLTYISSSFVSTNPAVELTTSVQGNRVTWSIPFLPADAVVTITLRVKANALTGNVPVTITNGVTVVSAEDEVTPGDNSDTDVNTVSPFFIPNVITPDGDGKNDTFEIKGLGKFVSNEIIIFNRYGDHVYQRKDYNNDWNAPGQVAGTYFYVLTAVDSQGRTHDFKGWIQVIK